MPTPTIVVVEPSPAHEPKAFNASVQFRIIVTIAATTLLSISLLGVFNYTFWAMLETIARLLHWNTGQGLTPGFPFTRRGWPADAALVLATLASWCVLYFGHDYAALIGTTRARKSLYEKSTRLLPEPLPATRFFVELRGEAKRLRFDDDTGWLFFENDRLLFVGDRVTATFPRSQVTETLRRDRNWGGLGASWQTLGLVAPWGWLRLLAKGEATRLSNTSREADNLEAALRTWLHTTS